VKLAERSGSVIWTQGDQEAFSSESEKRELIVVGGSRATAPKAWESAETSGDKDQKATFQHVGR